MGSLISSDNAIENEANSDLNEPQLVQQIVSVDSPFIYSSSQRGWIMRPDLASSTSTSSDRLNNHPFSHRSSTLTRLPVNVKNTRPIKTFATVIRNSIQLCADPLKRFDYRWLQFIFNIEVPVKVKVFFFTKETFDNQQIPTYSGEFEAESIYSTIGINQQFRCSLPLNIKDKNKLLFNETNIHTFPIVIEISPLKEIIKNNNHSRESYTVDTAEAVYIYAAAASPKILEDVFATVWPMKCLYQRARHKSTLYEMKEIYGLEDSTNDDGVHTDKSDILPSISSFNMRKECIICLTEPRMIAVLPCRHLCLCNSCAETFQNHEHRCPLCRQCISGLLRFNIINTTSS